MFGAYGTVYWTESEVNTRLEQYMVQASRDVLAKSVEHRVNSGNIFHIAWQ